LIQWLIQSLIGRAGRTAHHPAAAAIPSGRSGGLGLNSLGSRVKPGAVERFKKRAAF
jgi:hypothetical protein